MELDLPIQIYELGAGKPIVIITWLGEEPGLHSIMLNSHMDVVPVYEVGFFPGFELRVSYRLVGYPNERPSVCETSTYIEGYYLKMDFRAVNCVSRA
jgi:hypothetical protein